MQTGNGKAEGSGRNLSGKGEIGGGMPHSGMSVSKRGLRLVGRKNGRARFRGWARMAR